MFLFWKQINNNPEAREEWQLTNVETEVITQIRRCSKEPKTTSCPVYTYTLLYITPTDRFVPQLITFTRDLS